jgi:hypothetical protein
MNTSKICFVCKNSAKSKCSRCRNTYYCSVECQKIDYQSHKQTRCKNLVGIENTRMPITDKIQYIIAEFYIRRNYSMICGIYSRDFNLIPSLFINDNTPMFIDITEENKYKLIGILMRFFSKYTAVKFNISEWYALSYLMSNQFISLMDGNYFLTKEEIKSRKFEKIVSETNIDFIEPFENYLERIEKAKKLLKQCKNNEVYNDYFSIENWLTNKIEMDRKWKLMREDLKENKILFNSVFKDYMDFMYYNF